MSLKRIVRTVESGVQWCVLSVASHVELPTSGVVVRYMRSCGDAVYERADLQYGV